MTTRPTVLVVDQLPIFRELATLALSSLGRVISASDDERAREILRSEPPRLVLAHYPPSGPVNRSICETIKQTPDLAHLPVILLTAGDRPEHHAEAVRCGADDVLTKPLDRMSLLRAVRRLLDDPVARGLPRIEIETPVRLAHAGGEAWGIARNVSRGGIFVETDQDFRPSTEIQLEFPLPGRSAVLSPGATVVWVRISPQHRKRGLGLRFLGLDGASARSLEHYVQENRGVTASPALMEASQ